MRHIQFENPEVAQSLLKKLIYFDIFSHPLKPQELINFCNSPTLSKEEGIKTLKELINRGWINYKAGYYYLGTDSTKIERRLEGNRLAGLRMKDGKKYATLIANFPFVRAVFISGSLSKHVMKPDSDIDFFIITQPGKLWLCRALLTAYKKLILRNSHRNFCLNYFIDTNSLEIPDKNLFTATEIAFLLPMYNYLFYKEFMAANDWYRGDYPNIGLQPETYTITTFGIKNIFEYLLNNRVGNWLDQKSFAVISGFWRKKFSYFSEKSFSLNLRSQKNVSKHHPKAFQEYVLSRYSEKVILFELSTGFNLVEYSEKNIS